MGVLTRIRWLVNALAMAAPWRGVRRDIPAATVALLSLGLLACGATAAMLALSLKPPAATWSAFGLSVVVGLLSTGLLVLATLGRRRLLGWSQVALGVVVVAALVTTAGTVPPGAARWVAFGSAMAYLVIGSLILVAQAASGSRVVHLLEVREFSGRSSQVP